MKLLAKTLSLALITLPLLANAGARSASMQVSFTVTDACTVHASAGDNSAPTVACQLASPHLLTHAAPAAADGSNASIASNIGTTGTLTTGNAGTRDSTGARAQDWTLYF